jgi:zinc transport system substrate-binding protein
VHSGDSSEAEHEEADEHVWTSPVKAAEITEAIARKIAQIDPEHAETYLKNAKAYEEQILELDAQYRQIAENAARKTIVFGDRFPIRYFAEEYGLDYFAAFPGCSSESEPSASTLAFLIDKVREEEIPVVFTIEFSNGNIARAICESTGAEQRRFETCHNVTKEQMDSGATYVSLMTGNLESVREALGDRDE